MIVTVTMNPAIDKTVEIEKLILGGLNRIQKVEYDAGGKGINVSKTIRALGGESIAVGFLGGSAGKTIERVLNELDIKNDFIWVKGETRTNTKIFESGGNVTELNELGLDIPPEQLKKLLKRLENYANKDTLFVLSGSIPKNVDKNIYSDMIRIVHKKGAEVLVDADGEAFKNSIEACPDIIKPNRIELEEYAGLDCGASDEELLNISVKLAKKGIRMIAVSMGKSGAIFIKDGCAFKCPALSIKAHSSVGAGDAMVAALAYSWDNKIGFENTIRLGMAASAGAVTTIGTKAPSRELVNSLVKKVTMKKLK